MLASWLWCLVPALAFTGLAVLLSVATRNGIVGVLGPGLATLAMQPSVGPVPFQQTPVTYDVSVQPDGCYKAQSPPAFVGSQLMRDAAGHDVVNPLYTIYGCLNPL